MMALVYCAMAAGGVGLAFTALGLFAPHVPHELTHSLSSLFHAAGAH
jgi:hypothetical protein